MKTVIAIYYAEIGTKGKNKRDFEKQLLTNIKFQQKRNELPGEVKKELNRFILTSKDPWNEEQETKWQEVLSCTPGIGYFQIGKQEILSKPEDLFPMLKELWEKSSATTFRVSTRRSTKDYPLVSDEINRLAATYILENYPDSKVDLHNFDLNIQIRIIGTKAIISSSKQKGVGGLPIGSSGHGLVLLSGGIDSPVAAYLVQKRGLRTTFIHFHSYPQTSKASLTKVEDLAKDLEKFGGNSKLIMVPFLKAQQKILKDIPDKFRIIFYRRFMFKIAQEIALQKKAQCLITGESLGQVASQTIQNIDSVHQACSIPVLQPLISYDKVEIITLAKKIGTFETSIRPHEDCCTVYMPKNPETKSKKVEVLEIEKILDIDAIVQETIALI